MRNYKEFINSLYREYSIDFIKVENFSLALNKLIKIEIVENNRNKKSLLESFEKYAKSKNFNLAQRINEQLKSLENYGYNKIFEKNLESFSRLVIGLGSSHVLETALTLHHIFGIPYIPGSALKGVCRSLAFWKLSKEKGILNNEEKLNNFQEVFYGNLMKDVKEDEDKRVLKYQLLFGAQDFKGLLLFLDAYPILNENENIFELDIMNVHYPSYYEDNSGETPPGDWENPRPIVFLTVKPNVNFRIIVLFDKWRWNKIKEQNKELYNNVDLNLNNLKQELTDLIKEALKEFGVGAKTKLGYGILE